MSAKIAALFSGQGTQYPGMGKALYEASPTARAVYECAGDMLGFDVAKASFEATAEELSRTLTSQPAIFTLSMAAWAAAGDFLPPVAAVAGHSLGEFAALCCSGAYSLEDGFRLIKARAAAMEEAAGENPGAMAAILGSDEETVAAVCAEVPGFVLPVNLNLPSQTVISGDVEAVEAAAEKLAGGGARIVRLAVSSAFHTARMQSAAERFQAEITGIPFQPPRIDFYSNLTGGKLVPDDFPAYFARHMVSPVRFVEQVAALIADGVDTCVEFGPGRTVSTLAKKIARSLAVYNVESSDGLEKLREKLDL
jgi:[acyl-carrier-protein] S-malonyltransferase